MFESVDRSAEDFCGVLLEAYPKLKDAGGYMLFKCVANKRKLEDSSPDSLKAKVGATKTYIRPLQKDLDFEPVTPLPQGVSIGMC